MVGGKPRVDRVQSHEASREQPGDDEEHERKREFGGDEHPARAAPAAARRHRARRVFERIGFGRRRLQRGPDSEEDAGRERQANRETEHAPVDAGINCGRHAGRDELQQRDDKPARGQETQRAAGKRQHDAFGQKLPDEPAAAGAECHPDRELARPRRGADQQEIRDVRARNEQHRADRADEHDERGPDGPRQILLERYGAWGPSQGFRIVGRMVGTKLRAERVEPVRSGLDRDPRAQASNRAGKIVDAVDGRIAKRRAREARRDEHLALARDAAAGMMEAGWQHADDRVGIVVEPNAPSEHGRVPPEAPRPEAVGDHRQLRVTGHFVCLREHAANLRLDAEQREVIRAGEDALDPLGLVDVSQIRVGRPEPGDLLKDVRATAVGEELRHRHADVARARLDVVARDADELAGVTKGERPEQDPIRHAEDRNVGADAERQRQHGHRRESWRAAERADRVPGIEHQARHRGSRCFLGGS